MHIDDKQYKKLQNLIDIQSQDGNWNYDPYMHGLLQGLLLAQSVTYDLDFNPQTAPEFYLKDLKLIDKFNENGTSINE